MSENIRRNMVALRLQQAHQSETQMSVLWQHTGGKDDHISAGADIKEKLRITS
jgi:hypothetical protein